MNEAADSGDRIRLDPSWKAKVGDYLHRPDMQQLSGFLRDRKAAGARIFPPGPDIFAAFDVTPFDQVKVVILARTRTTAPARRTGCVSRCSRAWRFRHRWTTSSRRSSATWISRVRIMAACCRGRDRAC